MQARQRLYEPDNVPEAETLYPLTQANDFYEQLDSVIEGAIWIGTFNPIKTHYSGSFAFKNRRCHDAYCSLRKKKRFLIYL